MKANKNLKKEEEDLQIEDKVEILWIDMKNYGNIERVERTLEQKKNRFLAKMQIIKYLQLSISLSMSRKNLHPSYLKY